MLQFKSHRDARWPRADPEWKEQNKKWICFPRKDAHTQSLSIKYITDDWLCFCLFLNLNFCQGRTQNIFEGKKKPQILL